MKIQIAVATWGFNKRLCWMMSSVLQQKKEETPGPEVSFNLAYIRNTGVEEVRAFFETQGLKSAQVIFDSYDQFAYRGLVRNEQVKACDADWILFADSDMVYPTNFFHKIQTVLETTYKDSPKCLYLQRYSNEEAEAEALVNAPEFKYPCVVPDAYAKAEALRLRKCRNCGAGYFQIANMEQLRKNHKGLYQDVNVAIDGPIGTSLKNRSDRHFRRTLGADAMVLPDVGLQIHLQHPRQKNDYPK